MPLLMLLLQLLQLLCEPLALLCELRLQLLQRRLRLAKLQLQVLLEQGDLHQRHIQQRLNARRASRTAGPRGRAGQRVKMFYKKKPNSKMRLLLGVRVCVWCVVCVCVWCVHGVWCVRVACVWCVLCVV